MKTKFWMMILIGCISIVLLAGCSGVTAQQATVSPSASVIPAPATSVNASTATSLPPVNFNVGNQTGIWVNGQGTVMVTPNIANLSLGVSAQAAKVADAQSQAASAMSKVIAALISNGVDQKDISTRFYNINTVTRYDNTTQQSIITGYQVSNMVNITVRAIDKVGAIIDATAAAAGDLIRINGISFTVDNSDQYNSQARTLAMNDAKAKATQLAGLAGVNLGKPVYIVDNSAGSTVPVQTAAPIAAAAPAVTTPVSPGQVSITVSIQVAYSIQ
jgi:uncharacterized protein YggE